MAMTLTDMTKYHLAGVDGVAIAAKAFAIRMYVRDGSRVEAVICAPDLPQLQSVIAQLFQLPTGPDLELIRSVILMNQSDAEKLGIIQPEA